MTEPIVGCVNPDDFEMVDGTHIRPRDHLQWRHVATNYANAVTQAFDPNDGTAKDVAIHTLNAQWTNTTPISQYVYALMTRGGTKMIMQAQSRAYIRTNIGQIVGVAPANPTASTTVSKFGVGYSRGVTAANEAYYGILEVRMGERSSLVGDTKLVLPGETFKVSTALRFISEHWESLAIHNGDTETESEFNSGATQFDIYAYPAIS